MGGVEGPIPGGPTARIDAAEPFMQISADGGRACALTSASRVLCWGGRGGVVPVVVATGVPFASVSRGWRHTCGVSRDSTAYCWGENESGQLGNGSVNPRFNSGDSVVHRVDGDVRFRAIDAGFLSTCASSTDGAQYCWGDGSVVGAASADRCAHAGASSACALRPTRTTLRNVIAMASGFTHRCALVAGGQVYCWGNNETHAASASSSHMLRTPTLVVR
jgi:alpha-tubulin suppressor-like RCC1 family protein